MYFAIFFIFLGLYVLFMVFELVFLNGMNINAYGGKWLKRFKWLWVPIYGAIRLTKEVIFKEKR